MNPLLSEPHIVAVQNIIMGQLDLKRPQITPEARIIEDLGADSLDVIEISMKLEEEFGITLSDEAWDGVQTVADVYSTLANLPPLTTH